MNIVLFIVQEGTEIPAATENLVKLWCEHTAFQEMKTNFSGH